MTYEQPPIEERIDPMAGKVASQITQEVVRESIEILTAQLSISGLLNVRMAAMVELEKQRREEEYRG